MQSDDSRAAGNTAADLLTVAFGDDVTWQPQDDGSVHIISPTHGLTFRRLAPALASALERLRVPGIERGALRDGVAEQGGALALARLDYVLLRLERYGFITYSVPCGGRPLAVLTPISPDFSLPSTAPEPAAWQLSRFACWRLDGGRIVVESPRGHAVVHLREPGLAAVLASLARPLTTAELAAAGTRCVPGTSEKEWSLFLYLLHAAAVIVPADEDGKTDEATDPALQMWSFHELLFHTRTRVGRHRLPFGATYRFLGKTPPLPGVKPAAAHGISLPKPDMERLQAQDAPFTRVLEERRSVRTYGPEPITVEQLGEFLYRSVRIQRQYTHRIPLDGPAADRVRDGSANPDASGRGDPNVPPPSGPINLPHGPSVTVELSVRPSPAGGALHELETYVAVHRCQGLAPGLYHYDPLHHRLYPTGRDDEAVRRLIEDARQAALVSPEPQVLIILAARFGRLAWKYESMAYALTLKNAGAVLQTMYLVATAMGLAPTAVGAGNSDLFARAAGTDYYAETSVAEFMLGTRAP